MIELRAREERKELYHTVLRVVDAQTATEQAPGVRRSTITCLLTPPEGPHDPDAVASAIRAARENDDLLAWPDHAGRRRYTRADVAKLRRVAEWEAQRDHPRPALVGWAIRMVEEVGMPSDSLTICDACQTPIHVLAARHKGRPVHFSWRPRCLP